MSENDRIRHQLAGIAIPPVERWNPPLSGDMDLEIRRDGTWVHKGDPITRPELVRLFASVMRRDDDGHHYLVTPAEKWRIRVQDAPLHAIRVDAVESDAGPVLRFTTLTGDVVDAGKDHPLRVDFLAGGDEPRPYVRVRGNLWALINRPTFLELADRAELRTEDGREVLGVTSGGVFFVLGRI